MNKNFLKKTLFLLSFVFAFLSLQNLLPSKTKVVAYAQSASIKIIGTNYISLNSDMQSFQITAEIMDSGEYSGKDIIWFLNNTPIPKEKFNANSKPSISILTFTKNGDYLNVSPNTIWTIRAEIDLDASISDSHSILFKSTDSSIQVQVSALTQSFSEEGFSPFILNASDNSQNPNISDTFKWYRLIHSNMFKMISSEDQFTISGDNSEHLTFTPEAPGKYTFFAKIGEEYSNPITLTANFQAIESLQLSMRELDANEQGFPTYQFSLNNLNSNQDIDGITWRWRSSNLPKQYGGKDYFFEPKSYGTYQIYAEYKAGVILQSQTYTLDVRIDRTNEILKYSAIALGVMIIGLIFIIRRNIKQDKIW